MLTLANHMGAHGGHWSKNRGIPAGRNSWILRGVPGHGGCWWWESTQKNLGCKWNENTCGNSGEIYKSGVEMRGKFPQTFKHFNSLNNDIKSSLGYFQICDPSYVIILHFEILRGNTREISTWKHPQGFHRERRRKYPHRKFPSFPSNYHWEIMRKFPQGCSPGITQ